MQQAGDDVYVEQLPTIVDGGGSHLGMVCHIFSVVDGLITGVGANAIDRRLRWLSADYRTCRVEGAHLHR